MAVQNAIHRQNVFQNFPVSFLCNVNAKNWCPFHWFVVHRQNLKIVLSEFSRQPAFPAEHFNANCRAKRLALRSALRRLSTGAFAAILQGMAFVAFDALMHTLHTTQLTLFGMR
jgi:hypothetical protein